MNNSKLKAKTLKTDKALFDLLNIPPLMPEVYLNLGNHGSPLSLHERRVLRAQARWDDMLEFDQHSSAISAFDRADAAKFGHFASVAAFRKEGKR